MAKATPRTAGATTQFADDSQVLKASKAIVRHIHAHGLGPGDKLPSQAALRTTTGFSNDTLSSAMKFLGDTGILVRKAGSGTRVKNPDATVRGLWNVGVAAVSKSVLSNIPFFAQELGFVQAHLSEIGCRCRLYYPPVKSAVSAPMGFAAFPHLMADLSDGDLDAVISLADVDIASWPNRVAPPVFIGIRDDVPLGVLIDWRSMVRQAVQLLVRQGCRRLAVVSIDPPRPGHLCFWRGFQEGLALAGLPEAAGESITDRPGISVRQRGRWPAATLLARQKEQRPDGIIVTDDWLAMGLTAALHDAGGYVPRLAVQTNRQAPLSFALPATRFEVDADALAVRGVEMVLARLKKPVPARPETVWMCPCQVTDGH